LFGKAQLFSNCAKDWPGATAAGCDPASGLARDKRLAEGAATAFPAAQPGPRT
jgi:predicted lipoprotein with Yx(FWY)xxD motif